MAQMIVGIADLKIARSGILTSYGFGSCVGVVMYDPALKLAGLLHVMLPDSRSFEVVDNPLKFADTGIQQMLQELLMRGATRERLVCKLAGGASVYQKATDTPMFDIGRLNAERVKAVLRELSVPIIAEDLGGTCSRTIDYDIEGNRLAIKRVTQKGVQNIVL